MKLNIKRSLIAVSIAAGLFGASAFAVAQNADTKGDMQGKHRMERMAKMQAHKSEHQAKLRAELKLKPEQEAAWTAFVAGTAHGPRMGGRDGAQHAEMAKLTTPERLDKMMAMHAERSAEMAKRMEATKTLYAKLTPEQQKTFDAQGMGGFQRTGMKRGGEHRMAHQGHGMHKGEGKGKGEGMGKHSMHGGAPAAATK